MAIFILLKLLMLLGLFTDIKLRSWPGAWKQTDVPVTGFLTPCNRIECPKYDLIHSGDDYEIRYYDSPVWATTSAIYDNSFVNGTCTSFLRKARNDILSVPKKKKNLMSQINCPLFNYIQGKNKYNEKIEMTAPVVTEIAPYCDLSGYLVSFYVPKRNQADPPPATGISVKKWTPNYVAVRQFDGYALDSNVCDEAAALSASLSRTIWLDAINKSFPGIIVVAQYNSPFDFGNRVNEIWLFFDPSTIQQPAGHENKHVYE